MSNEQMTEAGPEQWESTAKSVASMIIEWVDGANSMGLDWRPGLVNVIQARLYRIAAPHVLPVSEKLTAEQALQRIADQPYSALLKTPGWAKEFAAAHLAALAASDGSADVEVIAALLYEAANPTMSWSYLYPSHNHLHAAVRQRYLEAAVRFQDGVAQRKEHSEPDEGRNDAGSTPAADPPQMNAEQFRHAQFMGGVGDEVWD